MARRLSTLNTNDKIKYGMHQVEAEEPQPLVWKIVAKNHVCEPAYPENSITLQADRIVDIRAFDAREPDNPNTGRKERGGNRFSKSNLHQWLNSNASAGNWYSPQHEYDAPPDTMESVKDYETFYVQRPGFLYYFTQKEIERILETSIRTLLTESIEGVKYEDFVTKIFIPSVTEICNVISGGVSEGAKWPVYDKIPLICCTQQLIDNNLLTKYRPKDLLEPWDYFTRTSDEHLTGNSRYVDFKGILRTLPSFYGEFGVLPVFNLSGDMFVTDEPDEDGAYQVLFFEKPIINAPNGNVGTFLIPYSQKYSINNAEEDELLTVTEYINNVPFRVLENQKSGSELTYDLAGEWDSLEGNSTHSASIEVFDGLLTERKDWTFTKKFVEPIIRKTSPNMSEKKPTSIYVGDLNNATVYPAVQLLVTNNALDENPKWEDATESYLAGKEYIFENEAKTAEKWATAVQHILTAYPAAVEIIVRNELLI